MEVRGSRWRAGGLLGSGPAMLTRRAICRFARSADDLTIGRTLDSVGIERSGEKTRAVGERIYWERMRPRERVGFQVRMDGVPRRFFERPVLRGQLEPERVARMQEVHQQRRGALSARQNAYRRVPGPRPPVILAPGLTFL